MVYQPPKPTRRKLDIEIPNRETTQTQSDRNGDSSSDTRGYIEVLGCNNPNALNYNPFATGCPPKNPLCCHFESPFNFPCDDDECYGPGQTTNQNFIFLCANRNDCPYGCEGISDTIIDGGDVQVLYGQGCTDQYSHINNCCIGLCESISNNDVYYSYQPAPISYCEEGGASGSADNTCVCTCAEAIQGYEGPNEDFSNYCNQDMFGRLWYNGDEDEPVFTEYGYEGCCTNDTYPINSLYWNDNNDMNFPTLLTGYDENISWEPGDHIYFVNCGEDGTECANINPFSEEMYLRIGALVYIPETGYQHAENWLDSYQSSADTYIPRAGFLIPIILDDNSYWSSLYPQPGGRFDMFIYKRSRGLFYRSDYYENNQGNLIFPKILTETNYPGTYENWPDEYQLFNNNIDHTKVLPTGGVQVVGCMDPEAYNFNINATLQEPEQCNYYIPKYGCTNELCENYDLDADIDDGTCYGCFGEDGEPVPDYLDMPVGGCMDERANNYNPNATYDDGSCDYSTISYISCQDYTSTVEANAYCQSVLSPTYRCSTNEDNERVCMNFAGDVSGDGIVDYTDFCMMVSHILQVPIQHELCGGMIGAGGVNPSTVFTESIPAGMIQYGDFDEDGVITLLDLQQLANLLIADRFSLYSDFNEAMMESENILQVLDEAKRIYNPPPISIVDTKPKPKPKPSSELEYKARIQNNMDTESPGLIGAIDRFVIEHPTDPQKVLVQETFKRGINDNRKLNFNNYQTRSTYTRTLDDCPLEWEIQCLENQICKMIGGIPQCIEPADWGIACDDFYWDYLNTFTHGGTNNSGVSGNIQKYLKEIQKNCWTAPYTQNEFGITQLVPNSGWDIDCLIRFDFDLRIDTGTAGQAFGLPENIVIDSWNDLITAATTAGIVTEVLNTIFKDSFSSRLGAELQNELEGAFSDFPFCNNPDTMCTSNLENGVCFYGVCVDVLDSAPSIEWRDFKVSWNEPSDAFGATTGNQNGYLALKYKPRNTQHAYGFSLGDDFVEFSYTVQFGQNGSNLGNQEDWTGTIAPSPPLYQPEILEGSDVFICNQTEWCASATNPVDCLIHSNVGGASGCCDWVEHGFEGQFSFLGECIPSPMADIPGPGAGNCVVDCSGFDSTQALQCEIFGCEFITAEAPDGTEISTCVEHICNVYNNQEWCNEQSNCEWDPVTETCQYDDTDCDNPDANCDLFCPDGSPTQRCGDCCITSNGTNVCDVESYCMGYEAAEYEYHLCQQEDLDPQNLTEFTEQCLLLGLNGVVEILIQEAIPGDCVTHPDTGVQPMQPGADCTQSSDCLTEPHWLLQCTKSHVHLGFKYGCQYENQSLWIPISQFQPDNCGICGGPGRGFYNGNLEDGNVGHGCSYVSDIACAHEGMGRCHCPDYTGPFLNQCCCNCECADGPGCTYSPGPGGCNCCGPPVIHEVCQGGENCVERELDGACKNWPSMCCNSDLSTGGGCNAAAYTGDYGVEGCPNLCGHCSTGSGVTIDVYDPCVQEEQPPGVNCCTDEITTDCVPSFMEEVTVWETQSCCTEGEDKYLDACGFCTCSGDGSIGHDQGCKYAYDCCGIANGPCVKRHSCCPDGAPDSQQCCCINGTAVQNAADNYGYYCPPPVQSRMSQEDIIDRILFKQIENGGAVSETERGSSSRGIYHAPTGWNYNQTTLQSFFYFDEGSILPTGQYLVDDSIVDVVSPDDAIAYFIGDVCVGWAYMELVQGDKYVLPIVLNDGSDYAVDYPNVGDSILNMDNGGHFKYYRAETGEIIEIINPSSCDGLTNTYFEDLLIHQMSGGSVGNSWIPVSLIDYGNNTNEICFINTEMTLNLDWGWNMVGFPLEMQDSSFSNLFGTDGPVFQITSTGLAASLHSEGFWVGSGGFTGVNSKDGYWVHTSEPTSITISGAAMSPGTPHYINYNESTLISYPYLYPQSVGCTLSGGFPGYPNDNHISKIIGQGESVFWSESIQTWIGDLQTFQPGKSYWVKHKTGSAPLIRLNDCTDDDVTPTTTNIHYFKFTYPENQYEMGIEELSEYLESQIPDNIPKPIRRFKKP